MKIAIVTGRYWPYIGGVERVVKQVYERLVKMGYEITIYATVTSYELYKVLKFSRIKGITIRNYLSFTFFDVHGNPSPLMLSDILKDQYDILHIHSIHNPTATVGYMATILKKNSNLVVSPYYHGKGHSTLTAIFWSLYTPLAKRVLELAKVIAVNSFSQKKLLIKHFNIDSSKFRLVPHDGIDLEKIKKARPIDTDDKVVLYVGRLVEYKNAHLGVIALKYLPHDFKYVVIGEGPMKNKLKKLAKEHGVEDRVLLLGYQPDENVWRWLKTARVLLQLSDVESFCMTCIEALAAGTPVVANNDSFGLKETIDLYPDYILEYAVGREPISNLAKLILKAHEMKPVKADVSRFSWDNIAREFDKLYREIIAIT